MNSRTLNYFLLIVIIGLVISMIITKRSDNSTEIKRNEHILINFDDKDLSLMKEMVNRFKEGKGSNFMLIPPIVDGGYWIHDVISNGKVITWTIDNTRDGMSSPRGKTEYKCKAIDLIESDEFYSFELSKCNNYEDDEKLGIFSFPKERLQ